MQKLSYVFVRTCLCFLLLSISQNASAHTFHTSLTRIEYNKEEQLAEITIQVFTHDLEEILTRRNGRKRVMLGKTPNAENMVFSYLQETLALKNSKGEIKQLSWIGMEQETDAVWLYVETKMPEGLEGASVRDKIFFDLLPDQVNLVHFKFDGKKADLMFKPGDDFKRIAEKN